MIDEKRLDHWKSPLGWCTCISRDLCQTHSEIDDHMHDILRLARLGLWAEEHGIPALKGYGVLAPIFNPSDDIFPLDEAQDLGGVARKALAALPLDSAN